MANALVGRTGVGRKVRDRRIETLGVGGAADDVAGRWHAFAGLGVARVNRSSTACVERAAADDLRRLGAFGDVFARAAVARPRVLAALVVAISAVSQADEAIDANRGRATGDRRSQVGQVGAGRGTRRRLLRQR